MAKKRKSWALGFQAQLKPPIPESLKAEVEQKARAIVEAVLKPEHIRPAPAEESWNYIVDIYTKWYRSYFYFCAKYRVPGPNAISPFFEAKFARLEYVGEQRFNLAYMRHTEAWLEIYTGLTLDQCLEAVRDNPAFHP